MSAPHGISHLVDGAIPGRSPVRSIGGRLSAPAADVHAEPTKTVALARDHEPGLGVAGIATRRVSTGYLGMHAGLRIAL